MEMAFKRPPAAVTQAMAYACVGRRVGGQGKGWPRDIQGRGYAAASRHARWAV